jgi:CheY-like chemotaxis protein
MNLTEEQLNKLFELASIENTKPYEEITSNDISLALVEIERKIYSFSSEIKVDSLADKKILIADDLELSIYQLSTLLKKIGIVPRVARHKEEALSELHKAFFDCVIVDLFIPDSEDGLDLIRTAVEKKDMNGNRSKVVVISGTDDSSLIDKCYECGADLYIQKDKDWHAKLLKYIGVTFRSDKSAAYTRYTINNNIVTFVLKRFNDSKVFEDVIKNINSSVYTGVKHIFFDLREIVTFDIENAYVFAEIYKICAEIGGKFILINPSKDIKEALTNAYLEDAIPYATTVEEAVSIVLKEESSNQAT